VWNPSQIQTFLMSVQRDRFAALFLLELTTGIRRGQIGRPPHPDTIRQRFDRLAAAAGLSRITFHDLRHSYATSALKAGVSPKVVSERIGHADAFFLQTYAHVLKNDDPYAAEQAASFLLGASWDSDDEHG
jgi:integrase